MSKPTLEELGVTQAEMRGFADMKLSQEELRALPGSRYIQGEGDDWHVHVDLAYPGCLKAMREIHQRYVATKNMLIVTPQQLMRKPPPLTPAQILASEAEIHEFMAINRARPTKSELRSLPGATYREKPNGSYVIDVDLTAPGARGAIRELRKKYVDLHRDRMSRVNAATDFVTVKGPHGDVRQIDAKLEETAERRGFKKVRKRRANA